MKSSLLKSFLLSALLFLQFSLFAQQDLKQTSHEVKSWISQNWQWLAGAAVVLLLIIAASGRKRSNKKITTIVKDDYGNVKSVSSTETIN